MQFDKYNIFRRVEDAVILSGAIISQNAHCRSLKKRFRNSFKKLQTGKYPNDTAKNSLTY